MSRALIYLFPFLLLSCSSSSKFDIEDVRSKLTDKNATDRTAILFHNIKEMTGKHVVYGQHNYDMDGFNADGSRWRDEDDRCDARDIVGVFPAMASYDFLHHTNPSSWETKDLDYIKKKFDAAYQRGNVLTFCWHYYNPVTLENFYDTTQVVKHILPEGSHHDIFKKDLKIIADFAHNAKDENGELIPIIFRPWHEFDGHWFWWGKPHCSVDEFKSLYQFTVSYLRDTLDVHNFLYAFSPDCGFTSEEEYLERYPGDEYVDIVGMDNYWDFRPDGGDINLVIQKSRILTKYAQEHGKLSAITETGTQTTDSLWYSQLLHILKAEGVALNYINLWSGFGPYVGHPAADDFLKFKQDSLILFADELPDVYNIKN